MQEKILLIFLKKEFFHIGVMYLKQNKKKNKKKNKKITKDDVITLNKRIIDEETDINEELFKKFKDLVI